jgi:MFS family permease
MERRAFVILFVSSFVAMVGFGALAPFLPTYVRELGATPFEVGLVFGGFAIARALTTPIAGRLSDVRGRKGVILVGLLLFSALTGLYPFAVTVSALALVRILQGISSTMVGPIAMAYAADMSPAAREGEHLGTFSMSMFLGMATGPILGGFLAHRLGVSATFWIIAGMAAVVALFVAVALPQRVGTARVPEPRRFRDLVLERPVQGLMLFRFANSVAMATLFAFLPLLAEDLGLSAAHIGTLITLYLLFSSALLRRGGRLADRKAKGPLMVAGTVIKMAGFAALPLAHGLTGLLVCLALMALGTAIGIPAATSLTAVLGRERGMGSLIGLFQMAMSAGMGVGPLIAGAVAMLLGEGFLFPIVAGVVLVLTVPALRLLPSDRSEEAEAGAPDASRA